MVLWHFVSEMQGFCNNLEVETVIYCPDGLGASPEAIVRANVPSFK